MHSNDTTTCTGTGYSEGNTAETQKKKVLFVCLGNICRSPAAQAVFQAVVDRHGMQESFMVDSAGIYQGHQGNLPDSRMRAAASARGYSLTHRARPVSALDFPDFDIVVAMDDNNFQDLMHLAPSVEDSRKVVRMASYLTTHSISYIPDPYYMGHEGFELVLDLLEEACANLFNSLICQEAVS